MPIGQYPRKPCSEETKDKIRKTLTGRKMPSYVIEKIATKLRGRKIPIEIALMRAESHRKYPKEFICLVCGKIFYNKYGQKNRKFCSIKCMGLGITGREISIETRKKLSLHRKGVKLTKEHSSSISKSLKGRKKTQEHKDKLRYANLGKPNFKIRGSKSHRWKGGITPINHKIRTSLEYINWRRKVFSRDNWTCQECGTRGGTLHAHHIKMFKDYPDIRVDVNNGITLCKTCHKKVHKK